MESRKKIENFDDFLAVIRVTKPVNYPQLYVQEGDNLRRVITEAMSTTRNPLREFFTRQFKSVRDNSDLIHFLGNDFFLETIKTGEQVIDTCWHLSCEEMKPILKALENKLPSMEFTSDQKTRLDNWQKRISKLDQTHSAVSNAPSTLWAKEPDAAPSKGIEPLSLRK